MNIYEVTDHLITLRELGDSTEPEQLAECFHKAMADAEGNFSAKVEGICKVIRELEIIRDARNAEAARLKVRAGHAENSVKRLKELLKQAIVLVQPDQKNVKAGAFSVTVANNGGKQKINVINQVPDKFMIDEVVSRPNEDMIRLKLEQGDKLEFAQLEPRGTHVRIS